MSEKGFTLIELLVVVLIIGVLAAIALPQYLRSVEKSRISEALITNRKIYDSLQRYILAQGYPSGEYIPARDALDIELSGGTWSEDGFEFTTKNFLYWAAATPNGVTSDAIRVKDGAFVYIFRLQKHNVFGQNDICITNETELGRSICRNIAGYTYSDTEY